MTEAAQTFEKQDASQTTSAASPVHPQPTATDEVKLTEAPAETATTELKAMSQQSHATERSAVTEVEATTSSSAVTETNGSKKRKLSDASTCHKTPHKPTTAEPSILPPLQQAAQSPTPPSTQQQQHSFDLEDYSIIPQTVRDLLTLLQLYGALTAGQLEYNLPVNNSPSLIQDVLEVLVCIGLVQKVQQDDETKIPRYCVSRGVPRADPVNLPVLQHEIFAAHRQANRSYERTKILQTALVSQDESSSQSPKEVLQRLLQEYPELQQDPVYMTAFRQCHVEASSLTNGEKTPRRNRTSTSSATIKKTARSRKSNALAKAESKGGIVVTAAAATKEVKAPPPDSSEPKNKLSTNVPVPQQTMVESTATKTPQPITTLSDGVAQEKST